MKRSNSKSKALSAFLKVAFVLIALVGCNQTGSGGSANGGTGGTTPPLPVSLSTPSHSA